MIANAKKLGISRTELRDALTPPPADRRDGALSDSQIAQFEPYVVTQEMTEEGTLDQTVKPVSGLKGIQEP